MIEPTFEGDFDLPQRALPVRLEAGGELARVTLRYAIYGRLNERRDNALLVCHALSGSARVADWWSALVGEGRAFDTSRFCVIGINVLGSCYGSTGALSVNPKTGKRYGGTFPLVTIRDMVRAQSPLIESLGIEKLYAAIGGSIGGMQALQWAIDFPERVARVIAIGACALGAMGLALNHLQRQAIYSDANFNEGNYDERAQPAKGLALARAIAMCSYKSAELFQDRFARNPNRNGEDPHNDLKSRFDVAGYLDYQGDIFTRRFDANAYVALSKAMDLFDPARGYDSEEDAFRRIRARTLLVGITSDWLFPARDVESLVARMRAAGVSARYFELISSHGHDAFLADADALAPAVKDSLNEPER